MKIAIFSHGAFISSKYCGECEKCEYLIIYDTETREYASRKSPSFYSQNPQDLILFLNMVFIKNIICSKKLEGFNVYEPKEKNASVERVIEEFISCCSGC